MTPGRRDRFFTGLGLSVATCMADPESLDCTGQSGGNAVTAKQPSFRNE